MFKNVIFVLICFVLLLFASQVVFSAEETVLFKALREAEQCFPPFLEECRVSFHWETIDTMKIDNDSKSQPVNFFYDLFGLQLIENHKGE